MLLQKLEKTIKQKSLLEDGEKVLVGVSGGSDSLALLHALHVLSRQYGWQIRAAHMNHQFRGEEADEDQEFVGRFCRELHIPVIIHSIDVPQFMKEKKMGAQEAARLLRYQFLQRAAEEGGETKIALAHHANDQIETILMRMVRGSGLEGLSGIPEKRVLGKTTIIRPLLSVFKKELIDYCVENKLKPREDSSNLSTKYQRNFFRLQLIPLLEKVNPNLDRGLLQFAEIIREENDFMEQTCQQFIEEVIEKREKHIIVITSKKLSTFHLALQRRMIKLILSYLHRNQANSFSFEHIEAIRHLTVASHPSHEIHLPGRIRIYKQYDQVFFCKEERDEQNKPYIYSLVVPGNTYIPEAKVHLCAEMMDRNKWALMENKGHAAVFDADQIDGPLYVRSREPGDKMTLFGMTGSKKVKDIFINHKIPIPVRNTIPLVTSKGKDQEKILWIAGLKRSNEAIITPQTKRFLYLYITTGGQNGNRY